MYRWWWLWCQCLELASPPFCSTTLQFVFGLLPRLNMTIIRMMMIKAIIYIQLIWSLDRSLPPGKWWWRVYYESDGDFPNHTIPNMCSANCVIPSVKAQTWHLPDRWSVGAFCSHVTQSANMVASVSDRWQWCNSTILAELPHQLTISLSFNRDIRNVFIVGGFHIWYIHQNLFRLATWWESPHE